MSQHETLPNQFEVLKYFLPHLRTAGKLYPAIATSKGRAGGKHNQNCKTDFKCFDLLGNLWPKFSVSIHIDGFHCKTYVSVSLCVLSCMCVIVYVIVYMSLYAYTQSLYAYIQSCVHCCVCVCICVIMYVCHCACLCMCVHVYACVSTCVSLCVHAVFVISLWSYVLSLPTPSTPLLTGSHLSLPPRKVSWSSF